VLTPIWTAVVGFVVCFAAGTGFQFLMGLPPEQVRRNLLPGVLTSLAVALYAFFAGRSRHALGGDLEK
jgi:hypothetical protein